MPARKTTMTFFVCSHCSRAYCIERGVDHHCPYCGYNLNFDVSGKTASVFVFENYVEKVCEYQYHYHEE